MRAAGRVARLQRGRRARRRRAALASEVRDRPPSATSFVDRLRERARNMPGVTFAEVATSPPFSGTGSTIHFNITGRPPRGPEEYILTGYRAISEGYFGALSVPLVAGRLFTNRDRDQSPPVAIVNETFVKKFLGGVTKQGVGARAQLGTVPDDESPEMEIVGVVGDTKQAFEAATQPTMFVPYRAVAARRNPRRHVPQPVDRAEDERQLRLAGRRACGPRWPRSIAISRWCGCGRWRTRCRSRWRSRGCGRRCWRCSRRWRWCCRSSASTA